ncbi:FAD-binding protein [bacterium]|nr:FAD-binding protein [bacterium]
MNDALVKQLGRIVGREHVAAGPTDVAVYRYDASVAEGVPDVVVFPADTEQTAAVVRAVGDAGVPCVARGFGTNLSGGSVATRGGVVVCLTRMNRILDVQPSQRTATAQVGVTNLELQDALAPLGYFFAPDPASQRVATLGGNIAENAGGPHCVKYGVTTNHVLGMTMVLPDGTVAHVGGAALDPPGYDVRGLLIGSEGTMGIATEVTVRILPRPERVITLLAVYDRAVDAARSVSAIIAAGIVPATLEMMDQPVIRAVEESLAIGLPTDAAALLIIEVEGPDAGLDDQADRIRHLCSDNACRTIRQARDEAERDELWAGRRGAFGALARIAPNFIVCDSTVPRNRLPEALELSAAIAARHEFLYANVFHAGDGNVHAVLFFDARDAEQSRRVHEAGMEIMRACVGLGGTITGEHGVGVEKIEAMRLVFSADDLAYQRSIRHVFDPAERFNPGKLLPEPRPGTDAPRDDAPPSDAVRDACDAVRAAIADRTCLLPVGTGRRADFGNASDREPTPLRSDALVGVVEHDVDNQTVAFGAGTRLADAQALLAPHNQWLPFRPPLADACTLGGLVALAAAGPERLAHGAPRDRLLGLRFVSGEGTLINAGGRVMKNVAGLDVVRLLAGSAGTLGFLTELTFRVATVPEACRALAVTGSLDQCSAAAAALLASQLEPIFVAAEPCDGAWTLSVGFEGLAVTVSEQMDRAAALCGRAGLAGPDRVDYPLLAGLHASRHAAIFAAPFVLRADVLLDAALPFARDAALDSLASALLVDLGCGRILAGLPPSTTSSGPPSPPSPCAPAATRSSRKPPPTSNAATTSSARRAPSGRSPIA